MINDNQRRKVAKKMREYDVAEFKESAIVPFLECLEHGYTNWRGILDELADLIDRPTAKREHNGAYWRCAHCGAFTRKDAVIIDGLDVVPLRHCGNCGRELDYD